MRICRDPCHCRPRLLRRRRISARPHRRRPQARPCRARPRPQALLPIPETPIVDGASTMSKARQPTVDPVWPNAALMIATLLHPSLIGGAGSGPALEQTVDLRGDGRPLCIVCIELYGSSRRS